MSPLPASGGIPLAAAQETESEGIEPVERRGGLVSAWLLLAFAVVGLGISAYLTTLHYAGVAPICSTGGVVNCGAVTSSVYSEVPGTSIPVTVPGMIWFIVSGALAWLPLSASRHGHPEPGWLRPAHLVWAVVGLASVLYFVWAEVVALHYICEWCTGVHVLVFLSLLTAIARLVPASPSSAGPR